MNRRDITITGTLQYRDGSPIAGANVRIWETDPFQPWNNDDLIVSDQTDINGSFTGTGRWRDSGDPREIGTYRYEVRHGSRQMTGNNITAPHNFFRQLETPWDRPVKPTIGKGERWANWNGNFGATIPRSNFRRPKNEAEVEQALRDAIRDGLKVKVVGSGHSMSAVAQPTSGQMAIDLEELSGGLRRYRFERPNADSLLGPGRSFARVRAGTTVRTTNVMLANNGQGLLNMGPFDGQKLAGVVNTNTHGNGLRWGGFADMVRSVEMFIVRPEAAGGHKVERWIIEPSNGISDRTLFEAQHPGWELAQDDQLFHSAVCGYGLFGVAVSYVIEVRNLFWLREHAESTTWGSVRNRLAALADETRRHPVHQLKLYLHTPQANTTSHNNIACRIERLREVPVRQKPSGWETKDDPLWPPMRPSGLANDVVSSLVGSRFLINGIRGTGKASVPVVVGLTKGFFQKKNGKEFNDGDKGDFTSQSVYYRAIRRRRDGTLRVDPTKRGNRIDNTMSEREPQAPDHAISTEFAVPVQSAARAIDAVLAAVAAGRINLVAPIGIRFSAASNHLLAPAYGREVAFIELAGTLPTMQRSRWSSYQHTYRAFFATVEAAVRQAVPQARTHLGKANTANATQLAADYPRFSDWIEMYAVFSKSGVFDCPIADTWGLPAASPPMSQAAARATMDQLKMA